jgi:class 3 adenylate cyclase
LTRTDEGRAMRSQLVPALAARDIPIRVGIDTGKCERRGNEWSGLGPRQLKGLPEEIDVYRLSRPSRR